MFLARESLFLRGGDNPAVPHQARRAVVIKRGNTEDVDCALAGSALCIRGWIHRAKSFIAYLTIRLPLRQLIFRPHPPLLCRARAGCRFMVPMRGKNGVGA